MQKSILGACLAISIAGVGCGSNTCKISDPESCGADSVCEEVSGQEEGKCFAPVQIEGKVFALDSSTGIAKATVTAVDANGSPAGAVAETGADGKYVLRVPSIRTDDKGTFTGKKITLRASATNYLSFPAGVRVSLPLDTTAAARTADDKPFILSGGLTDVGLIALEAALKDRPSISGKVEVMEGQRGVLVVAELPGSPGLTAIADDDGVFKIFNAAAGAYKVSAYSRGVNYTPADVTVVAGTDSTGVTLKRSTASTATVSGTVSLVAGANGAGTSVVLVVESTFNEALVRGEVPPGLRAPEPGTIPSLSGAYSIDGVPDGKYVVLAAFENDGNVRDPDPNISGTQIQHIVVAGGSTSAQPSFKVTGSIQMVGPGAGEAVEEVTGAPTFKWQPYSSAKSYEVVVFDSLGIKVWEKLDILDLKSSAGTIDVPFTGTALVAGKIYQWRATARGQALNPISLTEDLRGVFQVK